MAYEGNNNQQHTQQMPGQHARQAQQQQQYQQQAYQQQAYQPAQYRPQYQPQMRMMPADSTTTGQWVLNLFLVCIPIIGLILLFVWAFGSKTAPSKKNWARANLVWILIGIILSVAIIIVAMVLNIPVADYMQQYWQSYLNR
ncbi:MAG: hypothetical protein IKF56_06175 [Eggerthellaceae bacterium]|nr:hypothetical protein [Eggerthellaceae bacterium]